MDEARCHAASMTSPPSLIAPILALLAIMLVTLAAYVTGYFWLGESEDYPPVPGAPMIRLRVYDSQSWAALFEPAAKTETWLTGRDTSTGYTEAY
jgi:hypothetical protein